MFRTALWTVIVQQLLCAAEVATSSSYATASAALTTASAVSSSSPLPPFVSHVDDDAIREAMGLVKDRHARAVQAALHSYPTHLPPNQLDDASNDSPDFDASTVTLKEHKIGAPGTLPDFGITIPRSVRVTDPPLLSKEECQRVVRLAEEHFRGPWPMQRSGEYDVAGCWIKDVPAIKEWFVETVRDRLFPLLCRAFPDFVGRPEDLCVDQTYIFRYTAETGGRTGVHTDAGCLSFTIALNDKDEYTGGGTWFEGLQSSDDGGGSGNGRVLEMKVGQVAIRPGGVKHAGHAVESGVRYVIGGFCMNREKPEPVRMLLTPGSPEELASGSQMRALEAAVALNPAFFGSYTNLANEHKRQGNDRKAQEVLEYCLEHVHPLAGEAAYSLGMLYLEQSELAKAKECFETCLKDDPQDTEAMMALAQLCNQQGDRAGEESFYEKVLATPGTQARVRASAYCNLGVLHEGDESEIECYLRSLALRPDYFQARYSLASALASRERWLEAVEHFRAAVEMEGAPPEHAVQGLGLLYRAAVMHLQSTDPPRSQQEAMERVKSLMGAENYARLAASRGQ